MKPVTVRHIAPPAWTVSRRSKAGLKDWETVVVELLQQHRESETEILDLRATIEQGFGREGGGLPMVCSLPISTKFRLHGLSI